MKELCDAIYKALYKDMSMQTAALIVGLLLLASHVWALLKAPALMDKLKAVPRSQNVGTVVLTICFIWAWVIASSLDLGDFQRLRWLGQFAVPVVFVAMLFWVNEYLGARSIGILLLLASCPVLDAAFLQPPASRVALSLICYVWITLGLFWVGMPYTMRDQIAWATRTPGRFKALALAGAVYGVVLLALSFTAYKGF